MEHINMAFQNCFYFLDISSTWWDIVRLSITAIYWHSRYCDSFIHWYVCVCIWLDAPGHTNRPTDLKISEHVPLDGTSKWFFCFFRKNFFSIFFEKNVPFRSFQHNFVPSTLRNIILMSIPMFSGTSNRMVTFWKVPDEQGCQIWTLGLPEYRFF